jgi:hypothetical protein
LPAVLGAAKLPAALAPLLPYLAVIIPVTVALGVDSGDGEGGGEDAQGKDQFTHLLISFSKEARDHGPGRSINRSPSALLPADERLDATAARFAAWSRP